MDLFNRKLQTEPPAPEPASVVPVSGSVNPVAVVIDAILGGE